MDQKMTIAAAAEIIRPLADNAQRQADAYVQVDEALSTAINLGDAIERLTKEKGELEVDVATLTTAKRVVETQVDDAKALREREIAQAEAAAKIRTDELTADIRLMEGQLTDLKSRLAKDAEQGGLIATQRADELQAKLDRIEKAAEGRLADLQQQTVQAEAALHDAKVGLQKLSESAKGAAQG